MMVNDEGGDANVTQTECPSCHRLFCVLCKRFGNTKKKSSDEDDALVIELAKIKQWRRCPSCKFYVDKVEGCLHIKCRCGYQFCYGCGSVWKSSHVCRIRRT
ncbi:putative IBR domain, E3 ubiquitin ligase RBR family [Arabidopsis thaliana]